VITRSRAGIAATRQFSSVNCAGRHGQLDAHRQAGAAGPPGEE
jgi:hypothetical protein